MNQSITSSVTNRPEDKVRVLIVDDSPLICGALKQILSSVPGIEVIGCVPNGQEALSFLSSIPCDVCMLDVNMPGINGLTVLKQIMIKSKKDLQFKFLNYWRLNERKNHWHIGWNGPGGDT